MQKVQVGSSVSGQKTKAMIQTLRQDESLWPAVLVFFGTLFLLFIFPFFHPMLIFGFAFLTGAIAYKSPQFGTILGVLLAFPAIAYQSPLFAWLYLLVIALTLWEAWTHWYVISFLKIVICAPFAPFPLSLLGGFVQFGLSLAALRSGSRESILISIPSVIFILLLSTLWLTPNSAFMVTKSLGQDSIYLPAIDSLQRNSIDEPALAELPGAIFGSLGNVASWEVASKLSPALGKVFNNLIKLLLEDAALLQLIAWTGVLFLIGFLPGRVSGTHKQLMAGCILFLIPTTHWFITAIYDIPFPYEILAYTVVSIVLIGVLEHYNFQISRERLIMRQDNTKKFGKFGIEDMADGAGPQSMDEVGGYDDVKEELREAILTPLKNKELSIAYGIKPPRGILLFGPPGTGKTMLMKALSKELGIGFYYVKCSEILSEWYGESLPYSEKILIMQDGRTRLVPIGEVVEKKLKAKVLAFDAAGKAVFSEIKDYMRHKSTSPIYEVRTRTGRKIRVTGYHSLFALAGNEIRGIPTGELVPKSSHIAIPSSVPFSASPAKSLELLSSLRENDNGLSIKNAGEHVRKAISRLGAKETCKILGLKNVAYAKVVARRNIGVKASKFLALMEKANVEYDAKKLLLGVRKNYLPGSIPLDEDWAFFLGLWVAEGSYNRKDTVRISTSEKELPQIEKLVRKLFGRATIYGKKGKGRDIYICSKALYVLMHDMLGMQDGGDKKKAPEIAFSFQPSHLSAFLRGYFTGDGGVYENQKGFGTVEASTVSRTLADQLLYLLLCFGVVGRAYDKIEKHGLPSTRICLSGEPLRKFASTIGFMEGEKTVRLSRCHDLDIGRWHRGRQIPINGSMQNFISQNMPDYGKCATIGQDILQRWSDENGSDEFAHLTHSDIYWDRVESVTRVEDEEFVYDISVEPCQNFAGGFGGIFAHNSEKNITELFQTAKKTAPCILFFDEIDSIGKKRDSYSADDVAPRVLSVMLSEIDGFQSKNSKPVIIIGATNAPDTLDNALIRPGRLDKLIYMPLPDAKAREAVIRVHCAKIPIAEDVDVAKLAKMTERFSGADLANVVSEATRLTAKEAASKDMIIPVSMKHFLAVMKGMRPSVGLESLENYERFRLDFERRSGGTAGSSEQEAKEAAAVKWDDVIGLDAVRKTLLEAIEIPLLHDDLMKKYKVKPAKGLLLFGPPGCGKTMIVRAASSELAATFLSVSGADLIRKGPENAVRVLKETFNRAREQPPALIFIDEIEALAPSRSSYSSPLLTQLLQELDGVKELKNVMLVGATNKPSQIDNALLRPGRFDKIIYIPPPDAKGRAALFSNGLKGDFATNISLPALSAMTKGYSGADITAICQEAKMKLVQQSIAEEARMKGSREPTAIKQAVLSTEDLVSVLANRKPSISDSDLMEYEQFVQTYGERR